MLYYPSMNSLIAAPPLMLNTGLNSLFGIIYTIPNLYISSPQYPV
nr:MAG TPA: hypothetical protein [Caudoviricetes sp.]